MAVIEERDERLARYYDLEYRHFRDDVAFYLNFLNWTDPAHSGRVLELGCGTGRVSLALARAGFHVTALDLSQSMLDRCHNSATESKLKDSVETVLGDMSDPSALPRGPFRLAFCALNTFAYLQSTAQQLAMLRGVYTCLEPGGRLLLDLTPPSPETLIPAHGETVLQGSWPDAVAGTVVRKFVSGHVDYHSQRHSVTLLYDEEGADGAVWRTAQEIGFRWTGRYELELLLREAGYTVENVFGDYELTEYGVATERLIAVARSGIDA